MRRWSHGSPAASWTRSAPRRRSIVRFSPISRIAVSFSASSRTGAATSIVSARNSATRRTSRSSWIPGVPASASPTRGSSNMPSSQLAVPAADTLAVGDSFDRDIVPARRAGLRTAWLQPDAGRAAPDPSFVDFRLTSLAHLSACLPALPQHDDRPASAPSRRDRSGSGRTPGRGRPAEAARACRSDGRSSIASLDPIADAGATEVVIIINERSLAVRDHVSAGRWPFAVRWIVQTTPSSMHSFLLVLEALVGGADDRVLISTVDTVSPSGAFAEFVCDRQSQCRRRDAGAHDAGRRRAPAARPARRGSPRERDWRGRRRIPLRDRGLLFRAVAACWTKPTPRAAMACRRCGRFSRA